MKKSMLLLFAATATLLNTFTGCQKEAGPQGEPGKDGNANVHSQTFTVSNWQYSEPTYYADINYSAITSDVINNGAVLVYFANGNGGYSQLPITLYPSDEYSKTYEVVSFVGGVRIFITDSDLTQPISPGTQSFKIVAIGGSALKLNPDLLKDIEKAISPTSVTQ